MLINLIETIDAFTVFATYKIRPIDPPDSKFGDYCIIIYTFKFFS